MAIAGYNFIIIQKLISVVALQREHPEYANIPFKA